jgi:hypothetical protein
MNKTWTTAEGKTVEYAWMTSVHLVHTYNVLANRNDLTREQWPTLALNEQVGMMIQELKARGLVQWVNNGSGPLERLDRLAVPEHRETPLQMCMLRALLDVKPRSAPDIVRLFRQDMDKYIAVVERCVNKDERDRDIWTLFISYRVGHDHQAV